MSAGALAARLALDSSGFRAEMASAGNVADKELKRIGKQVQFVNDYIREMARAQATANQSSAGIAEGAKHMEHFGFQTAAAKRELIVLAHELSQGNYSKFGGSLMVLAERTNALSLVFSAAGLAIGATLAAIGGFAAAAVMGARQDSELRNSLILTGNVVGLNSSRFNAMAAAAAMAAGGTLGSGKDALQALVSTGKVSQEALGGATQATILLERLSGQSADEIAKDFAKMSDGVAKWAAEHNKQYHYLTASQFAYIKQLEDQGKADKAAAENFRILNERMGQVNSNLGLLERSWKGVKDWASEAWDAMKGVGRAQTTAEQLADARKRLEDMQARGPLNSVQGVVDSHNKGVERLRQEIYLLQEKARFENKSADMQAAQARKDEAKIAKMMEPSKLDEHAYVDLIADISKYNVESDILAGTTKKLADYESWAADQRSKLSKETEKLTAAQQKAAEAAITAAAARRKDAEAIQQSAQMEAEMQKLLQEKGLVNGKNTSYDDEKNIAATKYLDSITNDTKRAEQLVNGSFQRMEDAVINFAKTGKLSFSDLFGFMAEEYLRNVIRMGEKALLTDKSGAANVSLGGIWSAVTGWFSDGATSHANGLSYVPYDGYPAILHKGERVQTALEASGSTSTGGGIVIDNSGAVYNIGQGVSRGEVAAGIAEANNKLKADIRRSQKQGTFA